MNTGAMNNKTKQIKINLKIKTLLLIMIEIHDKLDLVFFLPAHKKIEQCKKEKLSRNYAPRARL